jgi:hypothetical protein
MTEKNGQSLDTLDPQGKNWVYPSAAESGHTQIVLPTLPGSPNSEERLLSKDFGQHVIGKIQASLDRQGYLTTGPQQGPAEIFHHYCGAAAGSGLLDSTALANMKTLAREFSEADDRNEYYAQVIKPWLGSLQPGKR